MDSDINNTIEIVKKKRGRKPTGKILKSSELSTLKNDEDCIIAHIPLKNSDIEKSLKIFELGYKKFF